MRRICMLSLLVVGWMVTTCLHAALAADDWKSLFNGSDFSGWKVPEGDNGHWKVVDGVIDYDAQSEAKGDKNLWTSKEYKNFVLQVDWRIKKTTGLYPVPTVLPNGTCKKDDQGKVIITKLPNADSGIYLRGTSKAQINIWCWPIGSGEIYGYRMDRSMPPNVVAGCTPKVCADNPVGEWNTFEITMQGERLTVVLNGKKVLDKARLPGVPEQGPIAFQHHGGFNKKTGQWSPASSLMQFRNIRIKELSATNEPDPASATYPVPRKGDWWTKRHASMNARVKQGNVDLLMIGDSITHGWEGKGKQVWQEYYSNRNAVNLGIGGDRTQHVIWRLENGNIGNNISPKLAVIMIGTNNSGDNTPEEIAEGVEVIVKKLRTDLPKMKILVLAIFPRGPNDADPRRQINMKANKLIAKLADGNMVMYQDIGDKFLEKDRTLTRKVMPDLLHPVEMSYRIWAKAIEPTIAEIVGPNK